MKLLMRVGTAMSVALSLTACSLGGLVGGGSKPATTLVTLSPEAAEPASIARTAGAGQAVAIGTPAVRRELGTVRVPVQVTPTDVQYVANLQLVDTPAKLFQGLLAETVRRSTNRVVLGSGETAIDPGVVVNGELQRFGYDAGSGQVVVTYDGSLSRAGSAGVETRRFTATAPADGTAASVGPALNRAANQVAQDVAKWIGG